MTFTPSKALDSEMVSAAPENGGLGIALSAILFSMITSAQQQDLQPLTCFPPRNFETTRLRLRALEAHDAQMIFDLYASDPVASRYMSFKCSEKVEETKAFVDAAAAYFSGGTSPVHHYVWVLQLKENGEPIGTVGFGPKNPTTLSGGYILNQRFWGKGYASEAWSCIIEWAKTQPGVLRIEAAHDPDNPNSGKVMQKAGMKFDEIRKKETVMPNLGPEPRDSVIYAWKRPEA